MTRRPAVITLVGVAPFAIAIVLASCGPASNAPATPAPSPISVCGVVTDLFVDDLYAGGFVSIEGTKYLIGGVRPAGRSITLPPSGTLKVGVTACLRGSVEKVADGFSLLEGSVTIP